MIERLFRLIALLGGLGLLGLLALTVAAVLMRKGFGSPLIGVFDISQVTLIVIVFSGMAHCGITRGHVAVELFNDFFSAQIQRVVNFLVNITTAVLLGFMSWVSLIRAFDARDLNEATMIIFIPHFPFMIIVALGLALYALASLMLAFGYKADAPESSA